MRNPNRRTRRIAPKRDPPYPAFIPNRHNTGSYPRNISLAHYRLPAELSGTGGLRGEEQVVEPFDHVDSSVGHRGRSGFELGVEREGVVGEVGRKEGVPDLEYKRTSERSGVEWCGSASRQQEEQQSSNQDRTKRDWKRKK
jgi:hypothetical protein